jgi:tRNA1Val (adenine37-N6)-methyltransferase
MTTPKSGETFDTILDGRIRIIQPREGYRFSIDSILLAHFVQIRDRDRVLELGAGCGVISIALAAMRRPREIVAVEIQPELAALIARNAKENQVEKVRAILADLRKLPNAEVARESLDVVIANPPYRASNAGRVSPHEARRLARSEAAATLEDFIAAASRCVRRGGRAAFVFAGDRSAELIATLCEHHLEPKRIRFVHAFADAPATSILIEARKHGGVAVAVAPPLIIFDAPGIYSREARTILREVASNSAAQ